MSVPWKNVDRKISSYLPGAPGIPRRPLGPWNTRRGRGETPRRYYTDTILWSKNFTVKILTTSPCSPDSPFGPSGPGKPVIFYELITLVECAVVCRWPVRWVSYNIITVKNTNLLVPRDRSDPSDRRSLSSTSGNRKKIYLSSLRENHANSAFVCNIVIFTPWRGSTIK